MKRKTIGVLGGMGPEATLDCFGKIIKNTPAQRDQDHLRVIIDSNPKVPDRTPAIIGDAESPVSVIVEGCHALERAGADFIIIPCVSAHFFLSEIQAQCNLPILSIFAAVTAAVKLNHPEIKAAGLLATTGTVKGCMFQEHLADEGIKTIVPDDAVQQSIMKAIYDIKNTWSSRSRAEITDDLVTASESLISQKSDGAQVIIAGCTEIPLALGQCHLSVPYFDSLNILARAAILHAGLTPVPLNVNR
jgi:aspartate racemase